MSHIPKNHLEHGAYYSGECRNACIARWNSKEQRFYHWRFKPVAYRKPYIETILCPEDESRLDVFYADHRLETEPFEIPMAESASWPHPECRCTLCNALLGVWDKIRTELCSACENSG